MTLRALLLDVDGVLVRGRPSDGRYWSSTIDQDLGLDIAVLQREFFSTHWDDVLTGRAALDERLAPVLARIAPHLTVDRLTEYWFAQDSRLDHRLLERVARARRHGMTVHLATNQEHRRARHLMEELGLSAHVDGIFHSAALGWRKPEPAFFAATTTKLGLEPAELLLVDDLKENVLAAAAAGWATVHWTDSPAAWAALEARLPG
ncbi:putative hydrolase of the HAD superfamily [Stella humosa]|uniref:Putative hydrolase of the HAD superfamily n=1 Tax=Stella humosa TaxID=94 RepID=A0A3N1M836_9PROT|nr:HAD-IA family hydrolase [Stella humosa]ROQ01992.1 putative hydrolase of the HAD superfamily [Stella humosa]BBK32381.1 haloacid dehalogenase [Stella humosa]